jgi:pyruvate,water dikinase
VRAYLEARLPGFSGSNQVPELAVIVQQLVPAEISGVLFTADPVNGRRHQMVGNYTTGLGDALVSGEVAPEEFTLTRPRGRYAGPMALKPFGRRLFKMGKRLERELGGPQDIEWAIAEGRLYLLQSRPITTLLGFDPIIGEFNDSLTGDYLWSCVNVGEAMSMVMTPFTWSLLSGAYAEMDVVPGFSMLGNIGGRPYQNVTVGMTIFRVLRRDTEELFREMGGVREEFLQSMDQYLEPLPGVSPLSILPNVLRMLAKQRAGLRNPEPFLAENPLWCRDWCQKIKGITETSDLVDVFELELTPRVKDVFWRVVATAWRQGELIGRLRRQLVDLAGQEDADTLLSSLSTADELLPSVGPLVGIARVARGEMSRETYLERWGHRSATETEAYLPRPAEDPGWLDNQLRAFRKAPVDVDALLVETGSRYRAAWERLAKRYPRKKKGIQQRLEDAAASTRTREAVRSELTRLVTVARAWVLRVGELTGLGEGAFFLTVEELLDLLRGRGAPIETIPARKETYERYKTLGPYPMTIHGRFDPFRWAADPDRRSDLFDAHGILSEIKIKTSEDLILGIPGSAGRYEGSVRYLDDPDQGEALLPGEVLVTSQTNIGWTLLFPRVGAVVTDVGAPLSHAAIVARELGVPAVVNCGDATRRLRTGDRVLVDGVQGQVTILARSEHSL